MSLHAMLRAREAAGSPVRVALIGAGKFATMFLAQARRTPGLHVLGVCDRDPQRARAALERAGFDAHARGAPDPGAALAQRRTHVGDDAGALVAADGVEVVIESTGDATAGVAHALACIEARRHVVMVNVEADVLAGAALAERARAADVVYSLAWGDQPALVADLVDWARTCGFEVTCAGKGTRYLPAYHASTPDTVWRHYGLTPEQAERGGLNPKMFNSFLDGTKSAIEMAAVANATGLAPPADGLAFPPCGSARLPEVLKAREHGGVLAHGGTVEVVSSLERDGTPVADDLRWGVYVTFEAPSDYVAACFSEYGLLTDRSGHHAALYRPHHLIGLELGVSVAAVALRGEATGGPRGFAADVVAVAKRDLRAGERIDGEGGYTVWGRLLPAAASVAAGALPIGLAHGVRLTRDVPAGEVLARADVEGLGDGPAQRLRAELEAKLRGRFAGS